MYAGHIGVALAAKGIAPRVPLAVLIFASQLPDWVDGTMCVIDCRFGPYEMYSHAFLPIALLSLGMTGLYFAVTRDLRGALLVGAVVVSHALLDYITGSKPTWAGGPRLGLMLYARPALDFLLEVLIALAGWLIYRKSLPAHRRASPAAWAILLLLIVVQLIADMFVIANRVPKC